MTNHIQKKPLFYSHHFWKRFCNWINPKAHFTRFYILIWIIICFISFFIPSTNTQSWTKFETFGQPFISHFTISIILVAMWSFAMLVLDIHDSHNLMALFCSLIGDVIIASGTLLVMTWLPGYLALTLSLILIAVCGILIIHMKHSMTEINHKVDELIHDNH